MKRIFYLILIIIGVLLQSFSIKQTETEISQNEAIKLAEQFIKDNGYTSENPDKSKINLEMFDLEINETLKNRHNSLQKKTFCFSKKNGEWHIGFLSTNVNLKKITAEQKNSDLAGRAIKVSFDGKEISIVHKDPRFSFFTKL